MVPLPPAVSASNGPPRGVAATINPPTVTGDGIKRHMVSRLELYSNRHNSPPVAGSCPLRQSPPWIRSSLRAGFSNGTTLV